MLDKFDEDGTNNVISSNRNSINNALYRIVKLLTVQSYGRKL